MHTLYLSLHLPHQAGANQTQACKMARDLIRADQHVTLIAQIPNHTSGIVLPDYKNKLYERTYPNSIAPSVRGLKMWLPARKTVCSPADAEALTSKSGLLTADPGLQQHLGQVRRAFIAERSDWQYNATPVEQPKQSLI